ncbi:hypothetical protein SLS58_006533 [Diplodia intermedia]|uniref:Uncharacterized protein n=1 Tax=Diplodia intermedia TaxID=856260 RepID=A0ABR3TN03_9PEZI
MESSWEEDTGPVEQWVNKDDEKKVLNRKARGHILQELVAFGPLPPNCRPVYVNDHGDEKIKYEFVFRNANGTEVKCIVECHPLSGKATNTLDRPRSVQEPPSQVQLEAFGFERPPLEYIATDWEWNTVDDPEVALYEAIKVSRMAGGLPHPSMESFERESFLAEIARQFSLSVVIAQLIGATDNVDLLDRRTFKRKSPGVFFRWACGRYQEFYPPIFLGRYLDRWYYLVAKKEPLYHIFTSVDTDVLTHNLWSGLRNKGFPLSLTGFCVTAPYLHQVLRLGKEIPPAMIDDFFIHLIHTSLEGESCTMAISTYSSPEAPTESMMTQDLLQAPVMQTKNRTMRKVSILLEDLVEECNRMCRRMEQAQTQHNLPGYYGPSEEEVEKEIVAMQKRWNLFDLEAFQEPAASQLIVAGRIVPFPSQEKEFAKPNTASSAQLRQSLGYVEVHSEETPLHQVTKPLEPPS